MTATIREGGSFQTWNDPNGNPLIALNRDGTISTEGIAFADGTTQTTASASGLRQGRVLISATDFLTLGTPFTLFTPSAGALIVPVSLNLVSNFVTTGYSNVDNLLFGWLGSSQTFFTQGAGGFCDGSTTQSQFASAQSSVASVQSNLTDFVDVPLQIEAQLSSSPSNPTGGDGTLTVDLLYYEIIP